MKRFRLGLSGTMFGFVPIRWTLIACNITSDEVNYAGWALTKFNGTPVSAGPVRGTIFVEIADA